MPCARSCPRTRKGGARPGRRVSDDAEEVFEPPSPEPGSVHIGSPRKSKKMSPGLGGGSRRGQLFDRLLGADLAGGFLASCNRACARMRARRPSGRSGTACRSGEVGHRGHAGREEPLRWLG